MKIKLENVRFRNVGYDIYSSYVIPVDAHYFRKGKLNPNKKYNVTIEEVK